MGTSYCRVAGGKGANQAVAMARLGATVMFVGSIGRDPEGETLKAQLSAEGVRTEFVSCCASAQTGLAVITLDDHGENSIMVILGANNLVSEEDVQAAFCARSYDALMLQLEIPPQTVIAACRLAEARGIPVVLDAGPAQAFPLEQLRGVHILTPNETETFVLTGIKPDTLHTAQCAAEMLMRRSNAHAVVMKLGNRGALLCTRGGACEHLPAYPIEAVDTTAAGDAFTAAMTLSYLQTGDLRRAVMWGNAAGALAAMNLGGQPSLPTLLNVEEFCSRQAAHAG
jgi:ribokinase